MRRLAYFAAVAGCVISVQSNHDVVNVTSGTVAAFSLSSARLTVVVDSRRGNSDPTIARDDHGCKVIGLSPTAIFFYTGGVSSASDPTTKKVIFSANALAKDAFSRFRNESGEARIRDTASAWAELMRRNIEAILTSSPNALWSAERQGLGGFGGIGPNGAPVLYLANIGINITPDQRASVAVRIEKAPPDGRIGSNEASFTTGIGEFLTGKTDRAKLANAKFAKVSATKPMLDRDVYRLIAAVEADIQWANDAKVGGPVDAVVLDSGKELKWIQRKQECYKVDQGRETRTPRSPASSRDRPRKFGATRD